jgi:enamine deaminase RidA (YjgF/YER057c/UK114 family)
MAVIGTANGFDLALSRDALEELEAMGMGAEGPSGEPIPGIARVRGRSQVTKRAISAPEVLNEAYDYAQPVSFSRGMRVDLPGATMLYLSGTASVDEQGRSVHVGDFPAQCLRTFRNLTRLLAAEEASWHDVIRTTCYLRDIERDYDVFNELRTKFMRNLGLEPLPASTGIQARLCRSDLLIEIEAIAVLPRE